MKLARLLNAFGGRVGDTLGRVQLAELCAVANKPAAHLVVSGDKGPVSLIYTTSARTRRPAPIPGDHYDGLHVPTAHGSMAAFGERGEALAAVAQRVARAVG